MTTKPRFWLKSDDGTIEIVSLSQETLQGALNVLYEAFYPYENVCIAVGLAKNRNAMKELDELVVNAARSGVSLVAVEKSSGTVVGVAFNAIQCKIAVKEHETYFANYIARCKEPSAKAILEVMVDFDKRCDLFEVLNVDCLLEILFLSTLPNHRGKKISSKLCEASLMLADALYKGENVKVSIDGGDLSLEPVPKAVWSIFTSFITQRLGEKFGFKREVVVSFDDLTYEGQKYSSKIDSKTLYATIEHKRLG